MLRRILITKADLQFGEFKGCILADASIWNREGCESREFDTTQYYCSMVDIFYLTEQGLLVQVDSHDASYKEGPISAIVVDDEWTKKFLL